MGSGLRGSAPGLPDSRGADPPSAGLGRGAGREWQREGGFAAALRDPWGEGGRRRLEDAARGWRGPGAGWTAPSPWGLDPRTVAACFPRTRGGSGRRKGGGVRREGSPSLVSSTPNTAPRTGSGPPCREPGEGEGCPDKRSLCL